MDATPAVTSETIVKVRIAGPNCPIEWLADCRIKRIHTVVGSIFGVHTAAIRRVLVELNRGAAEVDLHGYSRDGKKWVVLISLRDEA